MIDLGPLTPGEAIMLALFLDERTPRPDPDDHWLGLSDRLRVWARANLTPAAEEATR